MSQDKRLEAATFDRLVVDGDGTYEPFAERAYQNLVAEFVHACRPRAGMTLIDVGCGTGSFSRLWSAGGPRVYGVDLSTGAVMAASKRGGAMYLAGDAERLPFPDESADLVTFSSILHHIPDFAPAVREAWRVLRPGGVAFAFDPNVYAPPMFLLRHPRSPLYDTRGVSPQERPLRPAALRRAFQAAGLTVRQHCRAGLPYSHVGVGWVNRLLPLYNAYDAVLEHTRLARLIGSFTITVGRKP